VQAGLGIGCLGDHIACLPHGAEALEDPAWVTIGYEVDPADPWHSLPRTTPTSWLSCEAGQSVHQNHLETRSHKNGCTRSGCQPSVEKLSSALLICSAGLGRRPRASSPYGFRPNRATAHARRSPGLQCTQSIEQRFGVCKVWCLEALGEPSTHRGEQSTSLSMLALPRPEAGQTRGST
jgi:hypothetical protein